MLPFPTELDYLEKLKLSEINIQMVLLVMKSADFLVNAVEHIETMVIHTNGHYRAEMLSYFRSTAKNLHLTRNHGGKPFDVITSFEFCF